MIKLVWSLQYSVLRMRREGAKYSMFKFFREFCKRERKLDLHTSKIIVEVNFQRPGIGLGWPNKGYGETLSSKVMHLFKKSRGSLHSAQIHAGLSSIPVKSTTNGPGHR